MWTRTKLLQSSYSLSPNGLWPGRLLCPWDSPGKNTGVVLAFHSPGDLPYTGIESMSLMSLALAGGFFTTEPLVQQRPAKTQSSPEWTRKGTMFSYNGWWACQGRKLNSCSPLCHPCAFMSHPFKMENNKDFLDLTSDISIYKVSVPELNLESFVSVRRKKKTTQ